jgi:hypothetical protein
VSVKRQIILIPYWAQEALRRNQLPLATCLDFPKLRAVMAVGDLAAFVALQDCLPQIAGLRDATLGSLVLQWFHSVPIGSEAHQALSASVLPVAEDKSIKQELQARLFDPAAKLPQYEEPFNIYDLTPEFAGVVIYPGFYGHRGAGEQALGFVRAMLKALYVYEPHHEVAKTPLFRRYLSLLPA